MIIIVVLIGAFVMNYVLVKIYGHLWEKDLDARVEFQKEPSVEGRDATLTETIYNRKWLFLPVLQVGFQMHRNLRFADGENTSVSDQCYKIFFRWAAIRRSPGRSPFNVRNVGIMNSLRWNW